jgi:hypothetical protein
VDDLCKKRKEFNTLFIKEQRFNGLRFCFLLSGQQGDCTEKGR